jgi:hypothetical protein
MGQYGSSLNGLIWKYILMCYVKQLNI